MRRLSLSVAVLLALAGAVGLLAPSLAGEPPCLPTRIGLPLAPGLMGRPEPYETNVLVPFPQQDAAPVFASSIDPISRRVWVVLLLNTNDPSIGIDAFQEGRVMENLIDSTLTRSERADFVTLSVSQFRWSIIRARLQSLPVGPNETLFVYCNTHGRKASIDPKTPGQVQQELNLGDENKVPRKELLDELKRKNARLTVLITDACFELTRGDEEPEIRRSKFEEDVPVKPAIPGDPVRLMRSLLIGHRGVVDINSSSADQFAFGGVFTPTFDRVVRGWNKPQLGWTDFFKEMETQTQKVVDDALQEGKATREMRKQKKQTPVQFSLAEVDNLETFRETAAIREGPPEVEVPPGVDGSATIVVQLPEDAKLSLDGKLSDKTGDVRVFETAPIPSGRSRHFTFKAELTRQGKMLTSTKRVEALPGRKTGVDFRNMILPGAGVAELSVGNPPAVVTLLMPEDAKLTVNDVPRDVGSDLRILESPPLLPHQIYFYNVKVSVKRDGLVHTFNERVNVTAGEKKEVDINVWLRKRGVPPR